jgi:RNA polymerase sigma factor (sigma-70 family)
MKLFSLSRGDSAAGASVSSGEPVDARFEAILAAYGGYLRSVIQRFCPRDLGNQLNDIEQEARIRLWRALQSEKEIRSLSSYVYRIAATTTIDAVRHAKRLREDQLRLEGDDGEDEPMTKLPAATNASPEMIAVHRDRVAKVQQALGRIADNRRRAVKLHLQGLSFQEVARLLDWTDGKARNLIYRGLDDLRRELRELGIEEA